MSTCSAVDWVGNRHWPGYLNCLKEVKWMLGFAAILDKKCICERDALQTNQSHNSLQSQTTTVHSKFEK